MSPRPDHDSAAELPLNAIAPLLTLLARPGAFARIEGGRAVIYAARGGVTLAAGAAPARSLAALLAQGLAASDGAAERPTFRLSPAGGAAAHRVLAGETPTPEAGRRLSLALCAGADGETLLVNEAESPLLWLRRRKGRNGAGLISDAEFAAGERLRADIDRGRIAPRLTADWSRTAVDSSSGAGLTLSEAMIAARQRVEAAMLAVGPEFSGLLMDVCGFLKPIEAIERERGWPSRSAKVVLCLALQRLARHYGLGEAARGGDRARLSGWRSPGARAAFPDAGAQSA